MNTENWKKDYEEFEKVTRQFYAGEVSVPEYKGFSGGFGSYAQRGGKASMLRLRLPGGRVTKDKLKFVVDSIRKYNIDKVHFTTCQTIQLHNLNADARLRDCRGSTGPWHRHPRRRRRFSEKCDGIPAFRRGAGRVF